METNKENITRQDNSKNKQCFINNRFRETTGSSRKDFFNPKREN